MLRLFALLAILVALALPGTGNAILNGAPDDGEHPYVGLAGALVDGELFFSCSGAAISPTLVLVAAHCYGSALPEGAVPLITFAEEGPFASDPGYVTGTAYPHPDWCNVCGNGLVGFDRNDIAVVVLDEPLDLDRYAELPDLGYVDSLAMRTPLVSVGYGIQDRFQWLDEGEFLTRHQANTELIATQARLTADFITVTANPAQGKGGICFLDSGGPDLVGDVIVGVHAIGTNRNCAGVNYSNRVDIEPTLDFIQAFLDGDLP